MFAHLMPKYWYQVFSYNQRLDDLINEFIDWPGGLKQIALEHDKQPETSPVYKLGPLRLWISDSPAMAAILLEEDDMLLSLRPSRRTIHKLMQMKSQINVRG